MKKLNEDVVIQDPALASKYNQAMRAINDRLKKKAQLDREIVTYKEQLAAIEAQAIKNQVATVQATQGEQQKQQVTQQQGQAQQQQESLIPTFEDFLNEEDGDKPEWGTPDDVDDVDILLYDEEEENESLFFVRINSDSPALVKVYKEIDDEDEIWEMSVIEGDNTALDEMEFQADLSKAEIITYLADLYDDVEEVDREFVDDVIDDKEELDDDFYDED